MSQQLCCINLSSFICFWQKRSMLYCTILDILPITKPDSSSSLSLPPGGCSSSFSSSSPFPTSLELGRLFRLSLMAFKILSNLVSRLAVVSPACSAFLISSCFCLIAVSLYSTRFLATAVSLSTHSWFHRLFTSLLMQWVWCPFPTAIVSLDVKLRNAPRARTQSTSKPCLSWFGSVCPRVECAVDLLYLQAGSGKSSFFSALTVILCDDFVHGRHDGCCKKWTT